MDTQRPSQRHQLFVLRLWLAEGDGGKAEWRGVIENARRERVYFREWQVLLDFLQRACTEAEQQARHADDTLPSI